MSSSLTVFEFREEDDIWQVCFLCNYSPEPVKSYPSLSSFSLVYMRDIPWPKRFHLTIHRLSLPIVFDGLGQCHLTHLKPVLQVSLIGFLERLLVDILIAWWVDIMRNHSLHPLSCHPLTFTFRYLPCDLDKVVECAEEIAWGYSGRSFMKKTYG